MAKNTKSARTAKPAKASKAKTTNTNEFIGEDSLSSGTSRYMKLEKGDNQLRVVSKPITGWIEWIDKKPIRSAIDAEPEASDDENPPRKFLAMVVLDKADDQVKILDLTQQSVIKAMRALANNPEWGSPFTYDLNIQRTGEDFKTKYTVTPSPKKALSKEIVKEITETYCNLEALFEGEDPWDTEEPVTEYFFK
jgi:hypothetical protein